MSSSDFAFRCDLDDRELQNALNRLKRNVGIGVLKRAAHSGARVILAEARDKVSVKSGELKASLGLRQKTFRASVDVSVVARQPHAHLVEFGTKPHHAGKGSNSRKLLGKKSGRVHPGSEPKPFLRPAFDEKKDQAVEKAREVLSKAVLSGTAK